MASNFPSSLDNSTTLPAEGSSTPLATNHVTAHQNIQDALEAIEAKVGADSSAVTTSHDYKLSEVTSTDKAVGKTATQTLTNKTLTSPVVNVGSDATGDMYYRNAGVLTRIAIGTDNQILKLNGTTPNWEAETSTVDASTTVAGIVEEATGTETFAGTSTGGTGARLFVTPSTLFGGDGSDGALNVTSGTTTINLGTKSVWQYSSISVSVGATLNFSGGTSGDKVPVLLCQGTFNNAGTITTVGLGVAGGAGGALITDGSDGTQTVFPFVDNTVPQAGSKGIKADGTAVGGTLALKNATYFYPYALNGSGAGGGGGVKSADTGAGGVGGAGGAGSLGLILDRTY